MSLCYTCILISHQDLKTVVCTSNHTHLLIDYIMYMYIICMRIIESYIIYSVRRNPAQIPWGTNNVFTVIESTGIFTTIDKATVSTHTQIEVHVYTVYLNVR